MLRPSRAGLYVRLPDPDLRWALRRAAADRRTDTRRLVIEILSGWLADAGYGVGYPERPEASHE